MEGKIRRIEKKERKKTSKICFARYIFLIFAFIFAVYGSVQISTDISKVNVDSLDIKNISISYRDIYILRQWINVTKRNHEKLSFTEYKETVKKDKVYIILMMEKIEKIELDMEKIQYNRKKQSIVSRASANQTIDKCKQLQKLFLDERIHISNQKKVHKIIVSNLSYTDPMAMKIMHKFCNSMLYDVIIFYNCFIENEKKYEQLLLDEASNSNASTADGCLEKEKKVAEISVVINNCNFLFLDYLYRFLFKYSIKCLDILSCDINNVKILKDLHLVDKYVLRLDELDFIELDSDLLIYTTSANKMDLFVNTLIEIEEEKNIHAAEIHLLENFNFSTNTLNVLKKLEEENTKIIISSECIQNNLISKSVPISELCNLDRLYININCLKANFISETYPMWLKCKDINILIDSQHIPNEIKNLLKYIKENYLDPFGICYEKIWIIHTLLNTLESVNDACEFLFLIHSGSVQRLAEFWKNLSLSCKKEEENDIIDFLNNKYLSICINLTRKSVNERERLSDMLQIRADKNMFIDQRLYYSNIEIKGNKNEYASEQDLYDIENILHILGDFTVYILCIKDMLWEKSNAHVEKKIKKERDNILRKHHINIEVIYLINVSDIIVHYLLQMWTFENNITVCIDMFSNSILDYQNINSIYMGFYFNIERLYFLGLEKVLPIIYPEKCLLKNIFKEYLFYNNDPQFIVTDLIPKKFFDLTMFTMQNYCVYFDVIEWEFLLECIKNKKILSRVFFNYSKVIKIKNVNRKTLEECFDLFYTFIYICKQVYHVELEIQEVENLSSIFLIEIIDIVYAMFPNIKNIEIKNLYFKSNINDKEKEKRIKDILNIAKEHIIDSDYENIEEIYLKNITLSENNIKSIYCFKKFIEITETKKIKDSLEEIYSSRKNNIYIMMYKTMLNLKAAISKEINREKSAKSVCTNKEILMKYMQLFNSLTADSICAGCKQSYKQNENTNLFCILPCGDYFCYRCVYVYTLSGNGKYLCKKYVYNHLETKFLFITQTDPNPIDINVSFKLDEFEYMMFSYDNLLEPKEMVSFSISGLIYKWVIKTFDDDKFDHEY